MTPFPDPVSVSVFGPIDCCERIAICLTVCSYEQSHFLKCLVSSLLCFLCWSRNKHTSPEAALVRVFQIEQFLHCYEQASQDAR